MTVPNAWLPHRPVDEWDTGTPPPGPDTPGPAPSSVSRTPEVYGDVGEWVTGWLAPIYRRELTDSRLWCRTWFRHAEAISRLEGAWRAWEQLRRPAAEGGDEWFGVSVWWAQHGDPCLDRLMALGGPFSRCTAQACVAGGDDDLPALPCAPVPDGLFRR